MSTTKTRNCDYCHQTYQYKRSTSRFCCTEHRVSFNQYGEKQDTKLHDAIMACYATATDIRQNHKLATKDTEKLIIQLKAALIALEDDYWSAVSGQTNKHGGEEYRQCPECQHIMFGWRDELPADCPSCKAKKPKWIAK